MQNIIDLIREYMDTSPNRIDYLIAVIADTLEIDEDEFREEIKTNKDLNVEIVKPAKKVQPQRKTSSSRGCSSSRSC
jgi:hypothetical protein